MNNSIFIGYAGSIANSIAMDTVGNNVANINTTGFKGNSAEFSTIFESYLAMAGDNPVSSNIGHGTRIGASALDLSQGSFRESENTFNMAINGDGWFGVINDNVYNANDISFTRDGTFSQNADGYLVNGDQNYLLGTDYGIITKQADGTYIINTEIEPTAASSEVGKQNMLFAPKELYYPHIATTSATLQKNLFSESATQVKAAASGSDMKSLLSSSGELLDVKDGQDMLFSVGSSGAKYSNGRIEYSIPTADDNLTGNNSASFKLNGTDVTATWSEGATASAIADAIKSAIDASNLTDIGAIATEDGVKLTSDSSLLVTESDNIMISPAFISKIEYSQSGSGADKFASLDELGGIIKNGIESIYGAGSADLFVNSSGQLSVAAKDKELILDFKEASYSNDKLLENLGTISTTIAKNNIVSSNVFNIAGSTTYQKIIDEDGNENLLYVDMKQTSPKSGDTGSTWNADVRIVKSEGATELSDASELIVNTKEIGLLENQDMWFSLGNGDIRKTIYGYNYVIKAPADTGDGTGASISFDVNGTNINVSIADGSSSTQIANDIASALENAGISASTNYDEVYIHADDNMQELTISNATSTISDFSMPNHALYYAKYGSSGSNSFSTLEDINSLINSAAQSADISLSASIEESKFKIQNDGDSEMKFRILQGLDSNTGLLNILTPTYDPVQAGKSASTGTLETHTVLNETNQDITFDESSQLSDGTAITIKNGTKDLVVDLSGMTNFSTTIFDEFFSQNGHAQEDFEFYDIDQSGRIIANFSDGRAVAVSEVSLYHFQNDQGLEKIGSNQFIESSNSGKAFFYLDSEGNVTNLSSIQNKMLENSNVTTEKALTEMIVLQRAFESSAKIITTSDELLKNAINMKK